VDEALWRSAANEQLNESFFGDNYGPDQSFWVRLFEKANNRRYLKRIRRVLDEKKLWLLEIGVGSGSFLKYAKGAGIFPVGCDLSAAICHKVERSTGIRVHCGPLESLSDEHVYDVVVMNHVLEHVSDPIALLNAARVRLKPGGVLHLAVPNVACWEAQLPGWNSYQPYHLMYFTPQTLRATVERAGFEILQVVTHESFSGCFLAILRSLLRKKHLKQIRQESSAGVSHATFFVEHAYRLSMVASGVFTLPMRWLQEQLGKGDELVVVARNGSYD
jgi:2-polyprenyl-3-methyl-5-hydroxy-6-metoxy-1,4-benzoquinol methylase